MGFSATAKDTQDADCPTLETLMQRAQAGNASAYHLLLSEVANRMRRLVRRRAPWLRPEDVEDIVLSLHQGRNTWDPARPFLPWIVAIVRARFGLAHCRLDVCRTGRRWAPKGCEFPVTRPALAISR